LAVFAVGFVGILSFHYQEMVKPIPDLESLQQISAEGMRYTLIKAPRVSQYSFEFTDPDGRRYQTGYKEAEEARAIEEALHNRRPVILSVGRWQSALENEAIFTIYHMTSGERILINYADIAATKKKEQQGAIPVVVASFIIVVGTIAFLHRNQQKR
jgi:hypothetical protein